MSVIEILLLVIDVESQVNVMSKNIFALSNIHLLQLVDVLLEFINRLWCIFLFDNTLNVLNFLAEYPFESIEVLVSHILEDVIIICQNQSLSWWCWWGFWILVCIRFDNRSVYSD